MAENVQLITRLSKKLTLCIEVLHHSPQIISERENKGSQRWLLIVSLAHRSIKQTNAGAVYRLIDQLGPVSRIDLSRLAQLAPASITKIVREMLEAHLVQELEIKEAGSRGRPAVGLVVETEARHYLSLRISRGEIFLALRDLSSKLVVEDCLELPLNDETPLLARIVTLVDQFFIRHQQKLERLTSIAITLLALLIPRTDRTSDAVLCRCERDAAR